MNRRTVLRMLSTFPFLTSGVLARAENAFLARDIFVGTWHLYKARFVKEDGRLVDNVNGNITHSESQGYGMLLAVAANDRECFDRVWAWTQRNLYVRDDGLASWLWEPGANPPITDQNSATDGDLLIAWALMRARMLWRDETHLEQAREIVKAICENVIIDTAFGPALLPGAEGFTDFDQPDGPIINLSYWVFPAISELGLIAPNFPATELNNTGLTLLERASFGPKNLPANWISVTEDGVVPAINFDAYFSYDAIRIPLYLAWYSNARQDLLAPYQEEWLGDEGQISSLKEIELASGAVLGEISDPGYRGIPHVVSCAVGKPLRQGSGNNFVPAEYYPSTLYLLSLLALIERYPSCFVEQF